MSQTAEVEPDMSPFEKEIVEMKGDIKTLQKEMAEVKVQGTLHNEQIQSINKTLDKIDDNTTWIKRTITGAIITASCTGVIGGAIAIFYVTLQN